MGRLVMMALLLGIASPALAAESAPASAPAPTPASLPAAGPASMPASVPAVPAHPATDTAPLATGSEPPRKWAWGIMAGLMSGVVLMHAVQPIAAATGELPWKDKMWISIAGSVLYAGDLVGLLLRQRWALWVAIIGPLVGLTSVLTGWALSRAGVIDATVSPDTFQIIGGILQFGAAGLSVVMLHLKW